MWYQKCAFHMYGECRGKKERRRYEIPFYNYCWPIVWVCEKHKDKEITYIEALNSNSNVLIHNNEMTHTKDLLLTQVLESWMGNCEEIIFCSSCNGTGEEGDNIKAPIVCKKCNGTGRE